MNFTHPAQERCYEPLRRHLLDAFGERVAADPTEPYFVIEEGSAVVTVAVRPYGNDLAVVETYAWVVTDVDPTPELMQFLLEQNYALRFGAFAVDADNDVLFKHVIVAGGADHVTVDREELHASVAEVLKMADRYDDLIVERFGGMRARDRVKADDPVKPATAPEPL